LPPPVTRQSGFVKPTAKVEATSIAPPQRVQDEVMLRGRGSMSNVRNFGFGSRKRSRRRSRAPRKRGFAKRVKRVLAQVSEHKFKDAAVPNVTGEGWNQTNYRYEFNSNTPHVGVLKLCLPADMPTRATDLAVTGNNSAHLAGTFVGKRIDLTGYSITGVLQATAAAQANCTVRLHVLKISKNNFPTGSALNQFDGTNRCVGAYWYDNAYYSLGGATLNLTSTPLTATVANKSINLFDINTGDRHTDADGSRIGLFRHGWKKHPGFTIVKTYTLDGNQNFGTGDVSSRATPFKLFVPLKISMKFVDLDAAKTIEEFTSRLPRLYLLTEIVAQGTTDNATTHGYTVCMNAPRLHFKDHQ
jgi:hypothetical protein